LIPHRSLSTPARYAEKADQVRLHQLKPEYRLALAQAPAPRKPENW
jgi:hypothetical protein